MEDITYGAWCAHCYARLVFGCFRSLPDCQILRRVRGYLDTMTTQRHPLCKAIRSIMTRHPLIAPLFTPLN
jgi:hypothetical protein